MKWFWILIIVLSGTLLHGCNSQPMPLYTPDNIGNIYSRGIITDAAIEEGSTALFNASGGISLTNQVFTFNGTNWENEGTILNIDTSQETKLTALYPAYNDEETFITESPYTEGALEDVLIAKSTFSNQTDIDLSFTHLFSMLTIHVQSPFKETLTGISVTAPKITSINPADGTFTTSGEHTTHLDKNDTGDYSFIIPSIENCNLTLTFTTAEGDIPHSLTNTFLSGYKYECNVTNSDTRPGIRTIDDLIDFSLFINGKSDKRPWSDFGYKVKTATEEDTIYCLLNDITITTADATKIAKLYPIGDRSTKAFKQIFDGKGHIISGLKLQPSEGTLGLFGRIDQKGIIKGLHLNKCSSSSTTNTGSGLGVLAGVCYGTITNCSVTESSITTDSSSPTGGLVGNLHKNGNIINSFVQDTKVTSTGFAGSIAGSMNEANITNCYATSNTINTGSNNGGIAGSATNCNITNCYIYNITHSKTTGRGQIIGSAQNSTIYRIFYDKTTITLINDNKSNTINFNRGYNTETFKTNKENIDVFQLLEEWVEEQGENSIYTSWKESTALPAIFIE